MIAIIPVAGAGTKLRPHTYTQPKSLIPIAGKPLIGYIIDQLLDTGVKDFVFVIGYLGDKVRDFVDNTYPEIQKTYVIQQMREGVGHAIWLAGDKIKENDDAIIIFGDTIMDIDLKKVIQSQYSVIGVKKVKDPRLFGVANYDKDRKVTSLSEKPKIPMSNMAMVGLYMIKDFSKLYAALSHNIQNDIRSHNEFFLTDGLQKMIDDGETFIAEEIENWYDCGQKDVLLQMNRILLKKFANQSNISQQLENSIIVPPVYLGKKTIIKNSIIGPNVTIGNEATIESSILHDCIIGNYTHLDNVTLTDSLIGSDSKIHGATESLSVGDNTELDFR
ncbi:MAG: sugar phosphate nucleotidyltransferase [Chitinophagales bacterium]|nr:sugar phosphate nucleotidyltransferase [Chitinophagales bacterium]